MQNTRDRRDILDLEVKSIWGDGPSVRRVVSQNLGPTTDADITSSRQLRSMVQQHWILVAAKASWSR